MKFSVIIPAHDEQEFIAKTLDSLVNQTYLPSEIIVVNDNSSDKTPEIVAEFTKKHAFIKLLTITSKTEHLPGSKVIQAFNQGLTQICEDYDVIVKLDADLIFPENYFEKICEVFSNSPKVGMAGGFCYIEKNGQWILENLADKDHIRGALKAYRKELFAQMNGLRSQMGWDTADELLARFYGWEIVTLEELKVKHLKPTGATYNKAARYKQGEAYYTLGYGFWITSIAGLKLASKKKKPLLFLDYVKGYFKAKYEKKELMVTKEQANYIRRYRWRKIKSKII